MCNSGYCGDVTIDVNGDKGPNIYGKDIFLFILAKEGFYPSGSKNIKAFPAFCNRNASRAQNGYGCAAWVVMNGNMDYLHKDGLSLGF